MTLADLRRLGVITEPRRRESNIIYLPLPRRRSRARARARRIADHLIPAGLIAIGLGMWAGTFLRLVQGWLS
jgi:hypothetical protein